MISLDNFLFLSILVSISFSGLIFAKNLHKRLIFSFILIFTSVGLIDLKIAQRADLSGGINILIYIVPLLVILILIFEQFKKNLRD